MSRARFLADRPLLWILAAVGVIVVVVDGVAGRWSAVEVALLILVAGWIVESQYRRDRDAQQREADANARWALTGLMSGGEAWPTMGGWALGPAAVAEWIRRVSMMDAPHVVELGPGTSTVLLARAVPGASIHAVEHDAVFARRVRDSTSGMGSVRVVDAPLQASRAGVDWYAADAVASLPDQVHALLVDGPPNWDGKGRRAPARRIIEERLSEGALVLVDDTHRRDERSMVQSWVKDGLCRVLQDAGSHVFLEKI